MASVTISAAARRSGLSPKAIRLYEARGLLAAPVRTGSGYRTYSEPDVAVLQFSRQARALKLGLDEIRQILEVQQGGVPPCETVVGILDAHVREIDRTLVALRGLRKTLVTVRDSAKRTDTHGSRAAVCRIIESSDATPVSAPVASRPQPPLAHR